MKAGQATGLQIAFLMFAVMLLAVPLSAYIVRSGDLTGASRALVENGAHFALACVIIAAFRPLRSFAWRALSTPVPVSMRTEVIVVALAKLSSAFAAAGVAALWIWHTRDAGSLAALSPNAERQASSAYSASGIVRLGLMVLVGPIIEELVFRGFIYRAFERRWGWFASTAATSALFGLYHFYFWSAFAASVLYVCLMRRTGSLQAPILVHSFFNLMLWWPLLGQHVFPHGVDAGEISSFLFQFACLAFVMVALPIYAWMSRDSRTVAPTVMLEPHGALPR